MTKIFLSYSHKDEEWLERLLVHLEPIASRDAIDFWSDKRIAAGAKWRAEIETAIDSAVAAVLMISADFLASDFIKKVELPRLLRARKEKELLMLPLIVKPSVFLAVEALSEIEALNEPNLSLIEMSEASRERLLAKIAIDISHLVGPASDLDKTAAKVPEAEAEIATAEVFHPAGTEFARGPLEPCRFIIDPRYQTTRLWDIYADVWVKVVDAPISGSVYLIPSGFANPRLRDPRYLKHSEQDRQRKKNATIAFAHRFDRNELTGHRFAMKTAGGDERTKVYCEAYDRFLNAALSAEFSP